MSPEPVEEPSIRQPSSPVNWIVVAALSIGAFAGCGDPGGTSGVLVRLVNASTVTMDQATLYTSEGLVTFENLEAGAPSPYISVSVAYRHATTVVVVASDTLYLTVIDFVGETPLETGRYSYVLNVFDLGTQSPSLTQTFRRDDHGD